MCFFLLLMQRLVFNPATGKYQNQPGVDIRTSGFGDTCKTEYLFADPIEPGCGKQRPIIPYFDTMVKYFVKQYPRYYKRGVTIRAAPYDWRLAEGLIIKKMLSVLCLSFLLSQFRSVTSKWLLF